MTRDQALSKIKKCLALAKSSNPHEAGAAMRQAQKLMAEHSVTEMDLTLADVSESVTYAMHKTITPWEAELAAMMDAAFGVKHLCRHVRTITQQLNLVTRMEFVFVGVGAAPQVASYAYSVLARQCAKDRLEHIRKQPKTCKPITKTARGDVFAIGWVLAVKKLLQTFCGLERDTQLITQYMDTRYTDLKKKAIKDRAKGQNVSHNDMEQGYGAGKNARLNRGVTGMAQQGLLA